MKPQFNKKMGHIIKIMRLFHGIKQKHLAEKLNIKASLLSLYEQGKREPTLRFIKSLCDFNNITLADFFSLVEKNLENEEKIKPEIHKDIASNINDIFNDMEKIATTVSN